MAKDLKNPQVSVVMSVYNGAAHVKEAVDSILDQTFRDFELIIINDGSTDKTQKILSSYRDRRVHIVEQENQGLVASLSRGIGLAKAPLIARHDADDISEPARLEKQLAFLEADPDVCIVGSSMSVMNNKSKVLHEHRVLLHDPEIKQELLIRSPFAHGSVMFYKNVYKQAGGYWQEEWPAEDYGLWLRMVRYGKFANLDEPLYIYREHAGSISAHNGQLQLQKTRKLQRTARWQRHALMAGPISTADYLNRAMGQFRIERITHNVLFQLRSGFIRLNIFSVLSAVGLLMADKGLRRKCARLILVKLRLKHA